MNGEARSHNTHAPRRPARRDAGVASPAASEFLSFGLHTSVSSEVPGEGIWSRPDGSPRPTSFESFNCFTIKRACQPSDVKGLSIHT